MKKFLVYLLCTFLILNFSFAGWQEREIKRINRMANKLNNAKLLSKTQKVDGDDVKFYFTSKVQLVRMIEMTKVNGASILTHYYFDKKTGVLLHVNQGSTLFYYQSSGYFAVISSDNFSKEEAKKRADFLAQRAKLLKSKIQ
jgi:hypothetical protein